MIEKLKMQTPDITDKNIEQIAKLFPNVMTEIKNEAGNSKKVIDFDLLKQSLSDVLVDDENERYRLDWPGKKASLLKANTPISKTLRPVRKESVNFDTTENIYIEGDNFEVLKILQESYLGRIKMIYIDPPYNTGKDFIQKNYTNPDNDTRGAWTTSDLSANHKGPCFPINTVFIVQTNALIACFDDNINFKIVDEIADLKPFKVVFKDAGFSDDKDRINLEERFKRLSPETVITIL